jgi:hypothetical protein
MACKEIRLEGFDLFFEDEAEGEGMIDHLCPTGWLPLFFLFHRIEMVPKVLKCPPVVQEGQRIF